MITRVVAGVFFVFMEFKISLYEYWDTGTLGLVPYMEVICIFNMLECINRQFRGVRGQVRGCFLVDALGKRKLGFCI